MTRPTEAAIRGQELCEFEGNVRDYLRGFRDGAGPNFDIESLVLADADKTIVPFLHDASAIPLNEVLDLYDDVTDVWADRMNADESLDEVEVLLQAIVETLGPRL